MTKKPGVFIVDDEPLIVLTLTAIIERAGYGVEGFTDPRRALEALERVRPDLLISDVMMPDLTGVELAIQIKTHCAKCRVLLMSANAATISLLGQPTFSLCNFQCLQKPISPAELLNIIRENLTPEV